MWAPAFEQPHAFRNGISARSFDRNRAELKSLDAAPTRIESLLVHSR